MKKTNKIVVPLVLLVVIAVVGWLATRKAEPGKYDAFAQCLKTSGATFYGAFWCPHCQDQKKQFGSSVDLLPYVECSTPDGQDQTQICKDKKIQGYPTWEFKDGSRLEGVASFADLASKSGCALP